MKRTGLRLGLLLLLLLAPLGAAWALKPPAPPCASSSFEGETFIICPYSPRRYELRLVLNGKGGAPLRGLSALQKDLGADAPRVAFAMNAGIYGADGRPIGLYVENGRTVRGLNRRSANDGSNFYMKPNGVFWVDAQGVGHVDATDAYAAKAPKAVWATQSGPLLLRGGELHPQISRDGASRYVRNGVCVARQNTVFVISERPVSLGKLARYMRDQARCEDALYFDGAVSSLWAPNLGRQDGRTDLGPMVVVLKR